MKKIIPLLVLVLTGCKVGLTTKVNVSQLNSETPQTVMSELLVEVITCADHRDSRIESNSLMEAKKFVAKVLPKAEFKECFRQSMNSYASFNLPVVVGNNPSVKPEQDTFFIGSKPDSNLAMFVYIPKQLKAKVEAEKKRSFHSAAMKFDINIAVENDTSSAFKFRPVAVFVDESPITAIVDRNFELAPKTSMKFRLSDVSVALAMGKNDSAAPILLSPVPPVETKTAAN